MLDAWFKKNEKTTELEYIIREMTLKYYTNLSRDQIEIFFSVMSLKQKYDVLIKIIKNRYPNVCDYETKDILYGAELYREYITTFPQNPYLYNT